MSRKADTKSREPYPVNGSTAGLGGQVKIPKAAEIVSGALRSRIVRHDLAPGSLLPSEADMMAQFGVSRPTLREALRILEAEGLLTINRGAKGGALVHEPSLATVSRYFAVMLQMKGTMIGELYRVHAFLEPPAARIVAERRDPLAIERLRHSLEDLRSHLDNDSLYGADTARFRRTLIELAGIPTLTILAGVLDDLLERSWPSLTATAGSQVNNRRAKLRGLRSIGTLVDLIEEGDGASAEEHWREHIVTVERTMKAWLDTTRLVDLIDDFGPSDPR